MSAAKAKTKTPPKATEPEAEDQPKQGTWRDDLLRDGSNRPYPNLANVAIALRRAPELKGLLAYDEMQREVVVTRRLPGSRTRAKYPRQQDDTDATAIQEWLQQNALRRISKEPVQQAMELIARENAFHPVRTYLTGLRRDESKNLIDNWLTTYLGAPDTEYTRAIGKYFLIAMVARIMRPGCKADYMLVLEDPRQGTGKSGVAATLGGDWFSDGLPNLRRGDEVRISQHMRGKWIIEIADLSATDNAEDSTLKAFLTRTEERFTPKYGRNEVKEPREFIFIGSTNETTWLRDATGGRRFWPVPTYQQRPIKDVAKDLDEYEIGQIWAEAMNFYRNKEKLYFSDALEAVANEIQTEHSEQDPKTGMVLKYLDALLPERWEGMDIYQRRDWLRDCENDEAIQEAGVVERERVCISEIWCEALGNQQKDMTKYNIKDLHDIMRKAKGWKEYEGKLRFDMYGVQKCYVRIDKMDYGSTATFTATKQVHGNT